MPKYTSLAERLSKLSVEKPSRLSKTSPCHIWCGYTQKDGYVSKAEGYGRINLPRDGRSCKFPTHRVAKVLEEINTLVMSFDFYNQKDRVLFFDLYDAYSTVRLSIDHVCGNSLCINPDHLEWVYLSTNQQRKKWSSTKRILHFRFLAKQETDHHKILQRSTSVRQFIRKIQQRYPLKKEKHH